MVNKSDISKIFFSFSMKDQEKVKPIFQLMKTQKYSPYKFDENLKAGKSMWGEIQKNFNDSTIFLMFVSINWENSHSAQREYTTAFGRSVKDTNFLMIPIYLSKTQKVNWFLKDIIRIESFGDEKAKTTIKKIMNLINDESNTSHQKKESEKIVSISKDTKEKNIILKSEIEIEIEKIEILLDGRFEKLKIFNEYYISKIINYSIFSAEKLTYIEAKIFNLKFLGPKRNEKIRLNIHPEKILHFYLVDSKGIKHPIKLK